jgi:hypothetical protein
MFKFPFISFPFFGLAWYSQSPSSRSRSPAQARRSLRGVHQIENAVLRLRPTSERCNFFRRRVPPIHRAAQKKFERAVGNAIAPRVVGKKVVRQGSTVNSFSVLPNIHMPAGPSRRAIRAAGLGKNDTIDF